MRAGQDPGHAHQAARGTRRGRGRPAGCVQRAGGTARGGTERSGHRRRERGGQRAGGGEPVGGGQHRSARARLHLVRGRRTATTRRCSPPPRPRRRPATPTLTVFDGNLDPGTQVKQLQDAIASGKYDGIILQPVYGAGLVAGRQGRHRRRHRDRQHRPDPRRRQHDRRPPGRGPAVERRVRPERARPQDRRARRHGLRRHQPVQRRLHLVGQGRRARPDAEGSVRQGDVGQPEHQGRRRGRVVLHDPGGPQGGPEHADGAPRDQRDHGRRPGDHRRASRPSRTPASRTRSSWSATAAATIAFQGIKAGERFGTVMQAPATEGGLGTEQFIQAIRTGVPAAGRRRPRRPARRRGRHPGQRRHVPDPRGVAGLTFRGDRVMGHGRRPPRDPRGRQVVRRDPGARRRLGRRSWPAPFMPSSARTEPASPPSARSSPGSSRRTRASSSCAASRSRSARRVRPSSVASRSSPRRWPSSRSGRSPRTSSSGSSRDGSASSGAARLRERFDRLVDGRRLRPAGRRRRRVAPARQAAAGRDPAGARPRRRADRVRRTDGRAVGDRGPAVPRDRPHAHRAAAGRSSSSRTSLARCSRSPTPSPSCATARSSGPARRPARPRTPWSPRCSADRSAAPTRRSSPPTSDAPVALTVRDLTRRRRLRRIARDPGGRDRRPRGPRRGRPIRARPGDLRRRRRPPPARSMAGATRLPGTPLGSLRAKRRDDPGVSQGRRPDAAPTGPGERQPRQPALARAVRVRPPWRGVDPGVRRRCAGSPRRARSRRRPTRCPAATSRSSCSRAPSSPIPRC